MLNVARKRRCRRCRQWLRRCACTFPPLESKDQSSELDAPSDELGAAAADSLEMDSELVKLANMPSSSSLPRSTPLSQGSQAWGRS